MLPLSVRRGPRGAQAFSNHCNLILAVPVNPHGRKPLINRKLIQNIFYTLAVVRAVITPLPAVRRAVSLLSHRTPTLFRLPLVPNTI
jgi:hypothetical protein